MSSVLELSQKYIMDSKNNFQKAIEAIKRIRANLDATHRSLRAIQKCANLDVKV